jgi:hypothetical protein
MGEEEPSRFAVELVSRAGLANCPRWKLAFGVCAKDQRYYEKPLLPFLEPTRYDKTLRKFPNYHELA